MQSYPPVPTVTEYDVDPQWPQRPETVSAFDSVSGLAVDGTDHVWVFTRSSDPVQVYTADGRFVRTWGRGVFANPHFLRLDPEGNVWTSDTKAHVVRKFSPDGRLLLTLGTLNQSGCDTAHFDSPTDMAVTPNGDVFVTDGYGNRRVVHFDKNGRFVKEWGGFGVEAGQFVLPHTIVADARGVLYVGDRNSGRILLFNQDGKALDVWPDLLMPWGLGITGDDQIWACGSTPHAWFRNGKYLEFKDQVLMRLSTDGRVRQVWTLPLGKRNEPPRGNETVGVHAIARDSKGNLYVGDVFGRHAMKLTPAP